MTPEVKLYNLAKVNAALQADLGTSPFRWFDVPMPQNQWRPSGGDPVTCLRFRRVSTLPTYNQGGLMNLEGIRYTFEILAQFLETARAVADDLQAFMQTVDLCAPTQAPNFLLNRRESSDYQLQPVAQIVALDYRIFNRSDL